MDAGSDSFAYFVQLQHAGAVGTNHEQWVLAPAIILRSHHRLALSRTIQDSGRAIGPSGPGCDTLSLGHLLDRHASARPGERPRGRPSLHNRRVQARCTGYGEAGSDSHDANPELRAPVS